MKRHWSGFSPEGHNFDFTCDYIGPENLYTAFTNDDRSSTSMLHQSFFAPSSYAQTYRKSSHENVHRSSQLNNFFIQDSAVHSRFKKVNYKNCPTSLQNCNFKKGYPFSRPPYGKYMYESDRRTRLPMQFDNRSANPICTSAIDSQLVRTSTSQTTDLLSSTTSFNNANFTNTLCCSVPSTVASCTHSLIYHSFSVSSGHVVNAEVLNEKAIVNSEYSQTVKNTSIFPKNKQLLHSCVQNSTSLMKNVKSKQQDGVRFRKKMKNNISFETASSKSCKSAPASQHLRLSRPLKPFTNSERVAALRNVLNTSAHKFKSAHKFFVKDYLVDHSVGTVEKSDIVTWHLPTTCKCFSSVSDMSSISTVNVCLSSVDSTLEFLNNPLHTSQIKEDNIANRNATNLACSYKLSHSMKQNGLHCAQGTSATAVSHAKTAGGSGTSITDNAAGYAAILAKSIKSTFATQSKRICCTPAVQITSTKKAVVSPAISTEDTTVVWSKGIEGNTATEVKSIKDSVTVLSKKIVAGQARNTGDFAATQSETTVGTADEWSISTAGVTAIQVKYLKCIAATLAQHTADGVAPCTHNVCSSVSTVCSTPPISNSPISTNVRSTSIFTTVNSLCPEKFLPSDLSSPMLITVATLRTALSTTTSQYVNSASDVTSSMFQSMMTVPYVLSSSGIEDIVNVCNVSSSSLSQTIMTVSNVAPSAIPVCGKKATKCFSLSMDAMARVVNDPQSHKQRMQLANSLRDHCLDTVARTRHIQLDGVYDNMEDGESIQDVLKNISGLETIDDCAELKNIKLEDLTADDKLTLAELVDDLHSDFLVEKAPTQSDRMNCNPQLNTKLMTSDINGAVFSCPSIETPAEEYVLSQCPFSLNNVDSSIDMIAEPVHCLSSSCACSISEKDKKIECVSPHCPDAPGIGVDLLSFSNNVSLLKYGAEHLASSNQLPTVYSIQEATSLTVTSLNEAMQPGRSLSVTSFDEMTPGPVMKMAPLCEAMSSEAFVNIASFHETSRSPVSLNVVSNVCATTQLPKSIIVHISGTVPQFLSTKVLPVSEITQDYLTSKHLTIENCVKTALTANEPPLTDSIQMSQILKESCFTKSMQVLQTIKHLSVEECMQTSPTMTGQCFMGNMQMNSSLKDTTVMDSMQGSLISKPLSIAYVCVTSSLNSSQGMQPMFSSTSSNVAQHSDSIPFPMPLNECFIAQALPLLQPLTEDSVVKTVSVSFGENHSCFSNSAIVTTNEYHKILQDMNSTFLKQDTITEEIRIIDMKLSNRYQSLIGILQNMNQLQQQRVQLQSVNEKLCMHRNDLISGFTKCFNLQKPMDKQIGLLHHLPVCSIDPSKIFQTTPIVMLDKVCCNNCIIPAVLSTGIYSTPLNCMPDKNFSTKVLSTASHSEVGAMTEDRHFTPNASVNSNSGLSFKPHSGRHGEKNWSDCYSREICAFNPIKSISMSSSSDDSICAALSGLDSECCARHSDHMKFPYMSNAILPHDLPVCLSVLNSAQRCVRQSCVHVADDFLPASARHHEAGGSAAYVQAFCSNLIQQVACSAPFGWQSREENVNSLINDTLPGEPSLIGHGRLFPLMTEKNEVLMMSSSGVASEVISQQMSLLPSFSSVLSIPEPVQVVPCSLRQKELRLPTFSGANVQQDVLSLTSIQNNGLMFGVHSCSVTSMCYSNPSCMGHIASCCIPVAKMTSCVSLVSPNFNVLDKCCKQRICGKDCISSSQLPSLRNVSYCLKYGEDREMSTVVGCSTVVASMSNFSTASAESLTTVTDSEKGGIGNDVMVNGESYSDTEQQAVDSVSQSPCGWRRPRLAFHGPNVPVMGIDVLESSLYVGFCGVGVNRYTMAGKLCREEKVPGALCFSATPTGNCDQPCIAVGTSTCLAVYSTADWSMVLSHKTVAAVMCLLRAESTLYAGLANGAILVINLKVLQKPRHFQATEHAIHAMTWTREGSTRLLCVAARDANIHVVDSSSGLPVRIMGNHSKTAFSLTMYNHLVISGSGDRSVMAHNVHTAALIWQFRDHKGIVNSVCVHNDILFTAGYDKIVRCYDLKSCSPLFMLYGAGNETIQTMSICGSVLYTGNRDGQVEALHLQDVAAFTCQCMSCSAIYGLKDHLLHHVLADHLLTNHLCARCPWKKCSVMLDVTLSLTRVEKHIHQHIDSM